ncbi:KpsF/GutQ family sugar-phosphate isomerase [Oceanispirochaeta sp. M2]|nr:KpsF/GutQ family sugar-phosphate isomerase [Oceanispirochaeta sp. M2]NPD71301.1 KpsF/GutQ family sugar-phosphate isomerase [Oceanispirochaeta sp. M1]RDG33697.1 KpsF/GutQ family sugar-phosphate isomerase [Oceanispirochaeta sp. M1]
MNIDLLNPVLSNVRDVFDSEINSLILVKDRLDNSIVNAVKLISTKTGKVIITGIGKSGRIGEKIAATLSSVGSKSVFIHSTEAIHGDMGIVSSEDIVLAISYSGETDEVLRVVSYLNKKVDVISITGNPESTLAKKSQIHLNINVGKEACPLNLAPTSSTTATLVLGDALAIALMKERKFQDIDYAEFHPGGSLGRKLLCHVADEMYKKNLPTVTNGISVLEALPVMSSGKLGLVLLLDENNRVEGIFTDGDLRRLIESGNSFLDKKIREVVTSTPRSVKADMKMIDAEELMKRHKITSLIVEGDNGLEGILQIYNIN